MELDDENIGTMPVLERHVFNISALEDYMNSNVDGFKGPIKVEEFKGGQSNPTYKITSQTKPTY